MSDITSANPDELDAFADGTTTVRGMLEASASTALTTVTSAQANSGGRGLSATNLTALNTLLANMGANDAMVRGVATALRYADASDGVVTTTNADVVAQLSSTTATIAVEAVVINDVALLGAPATSGFVDDPICAANGNFIHVDRDLRFPGTSASLDIRRFYNSLAATRVGVFGAGWTSVLDVRLVGVTTDRLTAHLADGAIIAFTSDAGEWTTTDRRDLRLEHVETDGRESTVAWILSDGPAGTRRFLFDALGVLVGWQVNTSHVDIARDGLHRVVGLVERRSGRSIAVTWADGLVATLKTDDRRLVEYRYGTAQHLERTSTRTGTIDYGYVDGVMATAHDADGVTMFVNRYDDRGRVIEQTTEFGRIVTYGYDDAGSTVISDQHGVRQAMLHDRRGNLTAVVDVDGSAMRLSYDDRDRVVTVVSKSGQVWGYDFDPDTGDLVCRTDPDGRQHSWTWDAHGRKITETDRAGAVTHFVYTDEHDVPVRVIGPDGSAATATLDPFGQIESITDADGVVQHLTWDRDGQLTGVSDAEGNATTFEFDAAGLLTKIVDAAGVATHIDIDDAGRVARSRRSDAISTYDHTPAGRVCGGTEPGDIGWSATFGKTHGALETISDALGATVHFAYDHLGNVTTVTAPDRAEYRHDYDALGRLVATVDPAGAMTHHSYDVEGRLIEVVDAEGGVMRRSFDELGRTAGSTAADGSATHWTYHPNGEVATITEPDGRRWASEIDSLGRIVSVTSPGGRRAERTYTPGGRVARRTSPSGRVERHEYDRCGRCVAVVELDATGAEMGRRLMRYDERGLVIGLDSATAGAGERRLDVEWDELRRVAAYGSADERTRIERDGGGRVLSNIDPTGMATRYEWDQRGLLTAAIDPAGLRSDFTHDDRGRLIGQTTPGDRHTAWDYDQAGRFGSVTDPIGVIAMFERDANGTIIGSRRGDIGWTRELDAVGRETRRTSLDGAVLGSYEYDAAGRMTAARTSTPDVFTEFLWDDDNELVGQGLRGVPKRPSPHGERDGAGRLMIGPDGTLYAYDTAGRLAEIVPSAGEMPTRFEYDGAGLLRSETGPFGTRNFEHDRAGRVISISIPGIGTTAISYDEAGRRHSEREPDGSRVDYGWNALDQLTSITRTTSTGTTAVTIDHDALGRPARLNGVPLGDAGGDLVGGTAIGVPIGPLNILGARTYDRRTRQFLSSDPLCTVPGSNGASSAYTYAWHDPVNYVDPSGMRPISIEEYSAIREREENGRLGQAWQAIQDDPWGTLAAVGVVALGVGLMFTPAAAVGAGILFGAGMSAGIGLATGTFSPTAIAIAGVASGITGGVGALTSSATAAVATGAVVGAGSDLTNQMLGDGQVNWTQVLVSGTVGAGTAGIGVGTTTFNSSAARAAVTGATTDAGADVVTQLLTGDGTVDWSMVIVSGLEGGTSAAVGYHLDNRIAPRPAAGNEVTPIPLALEAGPPPPLMLNAGPSTQSSDMMTVYRGTNNVAELDLHHRTGVLASDAARQAYYGGGVDLDVAIAYSDSAHAVAADTWGGEAHYVEAHAAFGHELPAVSGARTMVSLTTDYERAAYFAQLDDGGAVFAAQVPVSELLPQTLPGAGEGEFLSVSSISMNPLEGPPVPG